MVWDLPEGFNSLLSSRFRGFGGRREKSCGIAVLAVIWVIWLERNMWTFEEHRELEVDDLWDKIVFWSSFWVSISVAFKGVNLSSILWNWKAALS